MLAVLNFTGFVASSGYAAIFILSVMQSCCVPTSSELTLGFAGVLASEGKLSLPGVIFVGAAGELVGAYIAWVVGRWGGRAFVDRYGKYVLMTSHDLDRAEAWYGRHERFGVLGSRLLPVIRNFVALPAGVAEVPLLRFGVLTAVGSLIWDSAMALIGYAIGSSYTKVAKGFSDAGYVLAAVVVLAIAVFLWHRWQSYKKATRRPGANPRSRDVAPGSDDRPPGGRDGAGPARARGTTAASRPRRGDIAAGRRTPAKRRPPSPSGPPASSPYRFYEEE